MRTVILMCLVAVLLTAGVANANTVWDPTQNGHVAGDVALWNEVPTNWANGTPSLTGDPKAVTNLANPAECLIPDHAVWGTLVMGDNGATGAQNCVIRIADGGWLEITGTSSWFSIGYSRNAGEMIVERGGKVTADSHLYQGMNGDPTKPEELGEGTLTINGGEVIIADSLRYGREANTKAFINLNAGLLEARYFNSSGPKCPVGDAIMDIGLGKMRLTGGENSDRDNLQRDIDDGYIVAFGGLATPVKAQEANGDWYVVADSDPLNRIPTMDAQVHTNAALDLSWNNLDPNSIANVEVEVWFGTDMTWIPQNDANLPGYPGDYADWAIVDSGTELTTTQVDASGDTQQYIWRVDTYLDPVPAPVTEGITMDFTAYDDLPVQSVVMEGVSMVTWAGESISLEATITDDGASALTVDWSAEDTSGDDAGPITDPNAVFSAEVVVDNGNGTFTATADVTIDYHAAGFTVTATASDLSVGGPVSDSQGHDCAESACQATNVLSYGDAYPGDIAVDCTHTLADFAALAEDWMTPYALSAPTEIPIPLP